MTKAKMETYRLDWSIALAEAVRKLKQNFNLDFVVRDTNVESDRLHGFLFNFSVTLPSGKTILFTTCPDKNYLNDLIMLPDTLCKRHGWVEDDPRLQKLSADEQNILRFASWLYSYYQEHKN